MNAHYILRAGSHLTAFTALGAAREIAGLSKMKLKGKGHNESRGLF
jgi:hypothetical protein